MVAQLVFCLVDRKRGVPNTAAALKPKVARQPGNDRGGSNTGWCVGRSGELETIVAPWGVGLGEGGTASQAEKGDSGAYCRDRGTHVAKERA